MRWKIILSALAALSVSFFAGCGGGGTPEGGGGGGGTGGGTEGGGTPLKIGYSDWPGWVAWEVAVAKGFFKEAGVDVEFTWFEYVPSMDAFAAGQLDAVCMTNGDTLVTGKGVMILINDYSNGNDMVVAKPGLADVAALKGKKIGVEQGFVSHLLLLNGLEKSGLSESDVTLVEVKTHETAQALASGDVDAIVAWQPNSGQALKEVAGSTAVYTSANEPGLIYDVLAVAPESLSARKDDWAKVLKAWYKAVDYIKDPATTDDAIKIMAGRVGIPAEDYAPLLKGTYIMTLDEAKARAAVAEGFGSLHGSTKIVDAFQVKNEVYKEAKNIEDFIDMSLLMGL